MTNRQPLVFGEIHRFKKLLQERLPSDSTKGVNHVIPRMSYHDSSLIHLAGRISAPRLLTA